MAPMMMGSQLVLIQVEGRGLVVLHPRRLAIQTLLFQHLRQMVRLNSLSIKGAVAEIRLLEFDRDAKPNDGAGTRCGTRAKTHCSFSPNPHLTFKP